MTTTVVVTTILSDFSFQKNFLIRNAVELRALWHDIALILLEEKKGFHLKTFLNKQYRLKILRQLKGRMFVLHRVRFQVQDNH
jgi:hypothetical protein